MQLNDILLFIRFIQFYLFIFILYFFSTIKIHYFAILFVNILVLLVLFRKIKVINNNFGITYNLCKRFVHIKSLLSLLSKKKKLVKLIIFIILALSQYIKIPTQKMTEKRKKKRKEREETYSILS